MVRKEVMTQMKTNVLTPRLIETDDFAFDFLSELAERESWRKEVHRPIYHVHKWWAKRLGSVFRGILLGCTLSPDQKLQTEFYKKHSLSSVSVFDPFMGSGTTIGEAHKLGMTALGRDINPVAVNAVETALGPMSRASLLQAFDGLSESVGEEIKRLYKSKDSLDRTCDVLYYFWVMNARCPECSTSVDLFNTYVIARNAYPKRKPEVQILCPNCADIFAGLYDSRSATCPSCKHEFNPDHGPANRTKATCTGCSHTFTILDSISENDSRPAFRMYGKLILTSDGVKEYLPTTIDDLRAYSSCSSRLCREIESNRLHLPQLRLAYGSNTRQAMRYGFHAWTDFFNDRQLLAISLLRTAIMDIEDPSTLRVMFTLLSGVLEFNNLFASYKGEGTGAVRHMFSHHILKPERTPIEANVWGTPKSSGAFINLFRTRLMRALDYRENPTEIKGKKGAKICAESFTGELHEPWPDPGTELQTNAIYLSCGDSTTTNLRDKSIDLVVTDPPFFDNVHYSELADFFFAWHQIGPDDKASSTRHVSEVQDSDAERFSNKLTGVFREIHRVLKNEGLLVFSYHHSRDDGWRALASALHDSEFNVVNSHPVKAEMSVATPKSQAKSPIQLDMILVCRKASAEIHEHHIDDAMKSAHAKLKRLGEIGFTLSRNDRKIVLFGQALTAISHPDQLTDISVRIEAESVVDIPVRKSKPKEFQRSLFETA